MPACFQLTRKGSTEPTSLSALDDEICALFGATPDPVRYYEGWFDSIGFKLATGSSFAQIREHYQKLPEDVRFQTMLRIVDYLDEHYTPDSWHESSPLGI